jgi:polyisoprenoid-binding protein YceI
VSGTVTGDDREPATAEVAVTINAASIDTREAQRDAHLRSADFFDVEKFPVLTFRSARAENITGDRFTLVGELTMHGVTREVALEVTPEGRATDPWGGQRAGFTASAKVKRSDFGLTWNQALETGGVLVGDEIKITIEAQLVKD